ncbi:MAG: hypothetical protein DMG49_09035 [Acidobacteria bacterium]|nr:MAG: hypothetical protein DMG49_09035 [Acidobacteriota bacterium]
MLLEDGGAAASRGDFFEFEARVAHFQDAKAIKQELALGDDIDFFAVSEEGAAGTTVGDGAVAEEF